MSWSSRKWKQEIFCNVTFVRRKFLLTFVFYLHVLSLLLNTLSEYTYFYISKDITLYTFLLVFKIMESLQCILKEINRLISKGMSNIYLKVTIEKKWRTQRFDYLSLKSLSPGQSLGSPNSRRYYWIFELLVAT